MIDGNLYNLKHVDYNIEGHKPNEWADLVEEMENIDHILCRKFW